MSNFVNSWCDMEDKFDKKRVYNVAEYDDIDEVARKLANGMTWTLCTAMKVGSLLLVNDSFSEDGAQEYGVIKDGWSIESLTVSWMKPDKLAAYLRGLETTVPGSEEFHYRRRVRKNHARLQYCPLCA